MRRGKRGSSPPRCPSRPLGAAQTAASPQPWPGLAPRGSPLQTGRSLGLSSRRSTSAQQPAGRGGPLLVGAKTKRHRCRSRGQSSVKPRAPSASETTRLAALLRSRRRASGPRAPSCSGTTATRCGGPSAPPSSRFSASTCRHSRPRVRPPAAPSRPPPRAPSPAHRLPAPPPELQGLVPPVLASQVAAPPAAQGRGRDAACGGSGGERGRERSTWAARPQPRGAGGGGSGRDSPGARRWAPPPCLPPLCGLFCCFRAPGRCAAAAPGTAILMLPRHFRFRDSPHFRPASGCPSGARGRAARPWEAPRRGNEARPGGSETVYLFAAVAARVSAAAAAVWSDTCPQLVGVRRCPGRGRRCCPEPEPGGRSLGPRRATRPGCRRRSFSFRVPGPALSSPRSGPAQRPAAGASAAVRAQPAAAQV